MASQTFTLSTTPYCAILKNDLRTSAGFKLWAWSPTATNITVTVLTTEQY